MREVAEISQRISGPKNSTGYINGAFFADPSDEGQKDVPNYSADDNKQKEASVAPKGVLAVIRQSRWMLPLIYTHIWMSASFSIIQPYFPPLAAAAGSVLNERLMAIASPRKCYLSGQIGFVLFTILLGSMYWSPGGNTFLGLSLVLAIIGGFFSTVYVVSAYTVSTMEFLWGSGSMIGCGISGLLIDAWAYPLPFFVLALLSSFSLPWTTRSQRIPDKPLKEVQPRPSSESSENQKSLFRLLIDPVFAIDMVTVMLSWIIMGFNEPTLEPHLRQFGIDTTELGVIFMVQFASYTLAALILGILCHWKMDAFCAFMGQLVTVFAYVVLGPAPFIPIEAAMWMVYLSQVFTGAGMAGQFICGYCHSLKHAVASGYSDDIKTTSFISTVVFTSLVFGATVTPPIAGYIVEIFGYRSGSMFLLGLLALWTPVTFVQWLLSSCCDKRRQQSH
ncbi:hypothetical protein MRX96_018211 [Rhipicephalus microplus]